MVWRADRKIDTHEIVQKTMQTRTHIHLPIKIKISTKIRIINHSSFLYLCFLLRKAGLSGNVMNEKVRDSEPTTRGTYVKKEQEFNSHEKKHLNVEINEKKTGIVRNERHHMPGTTSMLLSS